MLWPAVCRVFYDIVVRGTRPPVFQAPVGVVLFSMLCSLGRDGVPRTCRVLLYQACLELFVSYTCLPCIGGLSVVYYSALFPICCSIRLPSSNMRTLLCWVLVLEDPASEHMDLPVWLFLGWPMMVERPLYPKHGGLSFPGQWFGAPP